MVKVEVKNTAHLILFIACLVWGMGFTASAQELKFTKTTQVRKLIRSGKPNDALNIINGLVKPDPKKKVVPKTDVPEVAEGTEFDDSYLDGKKPKAGKDSTEYYFLTGLLKHSQFEQENTKFYLKHKPDTIAYFSRLYEMVESFEHCYPALKSLKKEDEEARGLLQQYKDHLGRGGNFYLAKNNVKKAFQFFSKYVNLSDKQLVTPSDSMLHRAYYNAAYVAEKLNDDQTVLRYCDELIRRGQATEEVDLLRCEALSRSGNRYDWQDALKQAIARHPSSFYFYAALIDYDIANDAADRALKYADELQKNDPMNGLKSFVKGYVYQHIGDYHNAIIWQEVCDRLDPNIPENMSALGYNYVALAEQYEASLQGNHVTPEARATLQEYYTKAKHYLEICREKVPSKINFWAPALYKVYYNLNDGDALDEIDAILHDGK